MCPVRHRCRKTGQPTRRLTIAPVRCYVRETNRHAREVSMLLTFDPGEEAQFDWHEG